MCTFQRHVKTELELFSLRPDIPGFQIIIYLQAAFSTLETAVPNGHGRRLAGVTKKQSSE